jgi:hypothetical protein
MIKRLDDYSYHKLISYFVDNLQKGEYKQYRDVDSVKESLIPKLEEDFSEKFPIGKIDNSGKSFKFKTARKTIEHFV